MGLLNKVEPTNMNINLHEKIIGIYGRPGIGKSTLANCFDGAFFAATEAGLSNLNGVHSANITSWDKPLREINGKIVGGFIPLCQELVKGEHPYKTLVIDTYDNLTRLCTMYMCEELGIDDIGSYKKFGAYHMVTENLFKALTKLTLTDFGLVLISHSKQIEEESKTKKWTKSTVCVSGKNANIMLDICDILLFMDSEMKGDEEIGVIRTKPSMYWDAKDKTKLLPDNIEYPLSDPTKAYEIIQSKFKGE